MTATPPASRPETFESQTRAHSRRRKIKAVVAAGTVLGIGAVATLATWNDSEFAQGLFGAGSYNVESSEDGNGFAEHPEGEPAQLQFSAANAAPGDKFAAPLWLRTDEETTIDGMITGITSVGTGQVENFVDVRVLEVTGGTCAAGSNSGNVIATGAHLGELEGALSKDEQIRLVNGESDTAGTSVQLCFQVTAADENILEPKAKASATWKVQTESVED
ncbi:SipW-dependent-type signal peptide-containing protein [Nesterenkonia sp. AY15]|nr:SipW-dependent-type signal peptide-containing protein [Nesterenkonia sp. AY15]MCH8569792.1 SipW-dependent-type signal peptide-containing protein [Nesterenkonia sp. AY15]